MLTINSPHKRALEPTPGNHFLFCIFFILYDTQHDFLHTRYVRDIKLGCEARRITIFRVKRTGALQLLPYMGGFRISKPLGDTHREYGIQKGTRAPLGMCSCFSSMAGAHGPQGHTSTRAERHIYMPNAGRRGSGVDH